jgi:hypothetical protein
MGDVFSSDDPIKTDDIHALASGNVKLIVHANQLTAECSTQILQGEPLLKKSRPSWDEALEAFLYAADQPTPHFNSCLRCAEYFWNIKIPPNLKQAVTYYKRAQGVFGHDRDLIHSGFMKMYYTFGVKATNENMKKDCLQKAWKHATQISNLDEEEYTILEQLSKFIEGLVITASKGSEMDRVLSTAIIRSSSKAATQEKKESGSVKSVERPLRSGPVIPEIARGYEEEYKLFYNGKLVYRPTSGTDEGKIELPIAALANALEGRFDLGRCGDTGMYLSINTGYKKEKKLENIERTEIWLVPRFLLESAPPQYRRIMDQWRLNAESKIGILWTWGGDDNLEWFDSLTTQGPEILSGNLYEKWCALDTLKPFCQRGPIWSSREACEYFYIDFRQPSI